MASMKESGIYTAFERLLAEQRLPVLAFRTNAGDHLAEGPAGRYRIRGLPRGFSDYLILLPGARVLFLEFKTETGRTTTAQDRFAASVAALGFSYTVQRSAAAAAAYVASRARDFTGETPSMQSPPDPGTPRTTR
jgi:hypothetical protein